MKRATRGKTRPIAEFALRYAAKRQADLRAGRGHKAEWAATAKKVAKVWLAGKTDSASALAEVGPSAASLELFLLHAIESPDAAERGVDLISLLRVLPHYPAFRTSAGAHLAFLATEEMVALGKDGVALTLLDAVRHPTTLEEAGPTWPQYHHLRALMDQCHPGSDAALMHVEEAIRVLTSSFPVPDPEYLEALVSLRKRLSGTLRAEREAQQLPSPLEMSPGTLWIEIRQTKHAREGRWRLGPQHSDWMSETETAVAKVFVHYLSKSLSGADQLFVMSREFEEQLLRQEQVSVSVDHLRGIRREVNAALSSVLQDNPLGSVPGSKGGLTFDCDTLHKQGIGAVTSRVTG